MDRGQSPHTIYLPQMEREVKTGQPLISRKIRSPLLSPSHQASASWPSLLAAGPGGAARLGLLPTAGRRGRAARGSRCRVAMETLPHPDCSWQRGPAARQALGGDPRERARQAAHGAARPPGRDTDTAPPPTDTPRSRSHRTHMYTGAPAAAAQAELQPKPSLQPPLINSANICRPSQCQARAGHCGCGDESHRDAAPPPPHLTAHRGDRHRNRVINTVTPTTATR